MTNTDDRPKCFVIAPLGEDGSEIRRRSDQILKFVIEPAAEVVGYEVTRADRIGEPGRISGQIIEHLLADEVVVADLGGTNPNVFYELAIRHVVRKPFIHIRDVGQVIPFDISDVRAVDVNVHDLDSVDTAKARLKTLFEHIRRAPNEPVDTPFTVGIELNALRGTKQDEEHLLAQVAADIVQMKESLGAIRAELGRERALRASPSPTSVLQSMLDSGKDRITQQDVFSELARRLSQAEGRLDPPSGFAGYQPS